LVVGVEIFRANYSVSGLDGLSVLERMVATRALRTGLIDSPSGNFTAGESATRLDFARAVMLGAGARVPQYLPDTPSFSDEPPDGAIFIESIVNSPFGNLAGTTGTLFNPQGPVDRATVALAIVKALGLDKEAVLASFNNPGLSDWNLIPPEARGYVSLVVSRNLMRPAFGRFRPTEPITRLELAAAAVALQLSSGSSFFQ
jgi:hypothetical protein